MAQTFDVLPEDRFQTVTRRAAGEIVCTPEFLGVRHSASVAFVQITCARVRALEMTKALYARTAADVAQERGLAAGDVIVNLVETARDNWSFGNGIAQCAL